MINKFAQRAFLAVSAVAVGVIAYLVVQAVLPGRSFRDRPVVARSRSAQEPSEAPAPGEAPGLPPGIEVGAGRNLIDTFRFNLDADEGDEQILVVKETDRADAPIVIVVIDYDAQTRAWKRLWEGPTDVTQIKTIQVSTKDLIGDHNVDIVVEGINDAGQRIMNVFWRTLSGQDVTYAPIASIAADSIEIAETDRPDSYKLGQSNAEAFDLVAFRPDPESPNLTDQLRETWEWKFRSTRYEIARVERVPGAQIEQKYISSVLDGNPATFEKFLSGVWYKDPLPEDDEQEIQYIIFDPAGKALHFHTSSLLETYSWDDGHLTRLGLFIGGRNTSVRTIKRMTDVELRGMDRISVRVMQTLYIKADPSARWNGVYQRVGPTMTAANAKPSPLTLVDAAALSGAYASDAAAVYEFAYPSWSRVEGPSSERGSYAAYRLKKDVVLELASVDADGRLVSRKTFLVKPGDAKSTAEGADLLRLPSLVLVPARMTLDGLELLESLPVKLRKNQ